MNGKDTPIHTIEPYYYLDHDIYLKEQTGIFAKTWQFAGHISQIKNPGDYFTFDVAGQSLFCVRGNDTVIRAFYNVCQHRAHELVFGEGNVSVVVCPYHAWTYHLDGQFRSGPNLKVVPGLDMSKICLTQVRVEDFHGFLFVNLDSKATPMDQWFPGARKELGEFVPNISELEPMHWVQVSERCNWKISVENYSECYHCRLNHKTFATGVINADTYDIQPQGYCLRHTTECQNLDRMSYPIDPDANPTAGKYSSWFLWPVFSFQVYPGNVLNTYHWRAMGAGDVDVWRGWYTAKGEESDIIRKLARQDRETTVEEDINLVESVQRGLGSQGYHPGPLVLDPNSGVNSEHSIRVLQQWMREGINGV